MKTKNIITNNWEWINGKCIYKPKVEVYIALNDLPEEIKQKYFQNKQ